jgi:hypothetical protein
MGTPMAWAQATLISPKWLDGPVSATTASTLCPVRVLVTTLRQPSTMPATPLTINIGTTINGTVAESTYLNGEESGNRLPSLSNRCNDVAETKAPGTRITGPLDDWVSCLLAVISDDPVPIPGLPCILNAIERLACKGFRRVARGAAKLSVGTVAVECSPGGKSYAAIILLDNLTTVNNS